MSNREICPLFLSGTERLSWKRSTEKTRAVVEQSAERRTIIVAAGAQYRKLDLPKLAQFNDHTLMLGALLAGSPPRAWDNLHVSPPVQWLSTGVDKWTLVR